MGIQLCLFLVAVSVFGGINCEWSCKTEMGIIIMTDVSTSQQIQACKPAINLNSSETTRLEIISPFLTVLEAGVFSGFRIGSLTIVAENLVRIEANIIPGECYATWITIKSNELVELNENQFANCTNLLSFNIDGTKVTSISFAWTKAYLREITVRNAYELKNIDRPLSNCVTSFLFENTGVTELPLYITDSWSCGYFNVARFIGNRNLKVLKALVFHSLPNHENTVRVTFVDTPIEVIEPNFMKTDTRATQLVLGGNKLGKIDQDTFEPILEYWIQEQMNPGMTFIAWDVAEERTSLPIKCDCSLKWIFSNENMTRFISDAVCENGTPLEELTALEFENCFQCPAESGLYPDPEDCHNFYQCSSYRPYLKYCPDGLVFNPDMNACDWAYNTAPPCGTATAA